MTTALHQPQSPSENDTPAPVHGRRPPIVTRAESAECTCPDVCERDHELD